MAFDPSQRTYWYVVVEYMPSDSDLFVGDMQLTKQEINETQIIVTTPEKWDVVTRKPTGEGELASVSFLHFPDLTLVQTRYFRK